MIAIGDEEVGINKWMSGLADVIEVTFKVYLALSKSVFFYVIPMKQPWMGVTGIIEVCSDIQDYLKTAGSQYRLRCYISQNSDWQTLVIPFDFRRINKAYYSIFAAHK